MSRVEITTVQGIGDLHWCYQKLAPYYDEIFYNVLTTDTSCQVQTRANEFLSMLPKYGGHKFTATDLPSYVRVAKIKPLLTREMGKPWFEYSVNGWLEEGLPIREIDHGLEVLDHVELNGVPEERPAQENALCVFVAGAKREDLWTPTLWAMATFEIARKMQTDQVRLIGAAWDVPHQNEVEHVLRNDFGLKVENMTAQLNLADSISIIRRSRVFFGYQSGLNVLAENYQIDQLNVIFDDLPAMRRAWTNPAQKNFHDMLFRDYTILQEKIAWVRPA
jgi:hypothetical protein